MAAVAVCQRKICSSLFGSLLQLSQLRSSTTVRTHLRFASSSEKQPKFKKNTAASKSLLGNNNQQEPPKLIKLFDEAGVLLPVVEKNEAVKQAKLKELILVQINEDKLESHYQLMTGKQLYEARLIQKKTKNVKTNVEKTFQIKSNISEHDLVIKLKKVKELLDKNINIRMKIKVLKCDNEVESREIQLKFLKRLTEEISSLATVKEANSTVTELVVLLRIKVSNV